MFRSKRRVPLYTHQIEQDYSNRILRIKTQLELYNDLKQIAEDLPNSPQIIQLKAITQKKIIEDIGILQQTGFDITSLIATFGVKLLKAEIIDAENTITEKQAMATSDAGVVVDLVPEDRILADRAPMVISRDARRARVQRVIARRASRARSQEREADPHPIDMPAPIVEAPAAVVEAPAAVVEEEKKEEEKKAPSERLDALEMMEGSTWYDQLKQVVVQYQRGGESPTVEEGAVVATPQLKVHKQMGIDKIEQYISDQLTSGQDVDMRVLIYLIVNNPMVVSKINTRGYPLEATEKNASKPAHAIYIAYHIVQDKIKRMGLDVSKLSYKKFINDMIGMNSYFTRAIQGQPIRMEDLTTAASVTTKKQRGSKKK